MRFMDASSPRQFQGTERISKFRRGYVAGLSFVIQPGRNGILDLAR